MNNQIENKQLNNDRSWEKIVLKYTKPSIRRSVWQIINTFIPYLGIWYLLYLSMQWPYWTTLLLIILEAGFTIRLFILFHDCGHGSFFASKKLNDLVGKILGVFVFTPYTSWHHSHKIHHATAGNLDKRGSGDVWTMTVNEYNTAPPRKRIMYRLYRNPWFMFTVGPLYMILVNNRLTKRKMNTNDKKNVYFTNIMLLLVTGFMSWLIGPESFFLIQIPVILLAHVMGVWLFYVQHQFDDVYWENDNEWDYKEAAIEGSSFLKLPVILQWFTGNIGFHHIHHLSPRIPNYYLPVCHYENEFFRNIRPMTLRSGMKSLKLRLWDDISERMITFRQVKNTSFSDAVNSIAVKKIIPQTK